MGTVSNEGSTTTVEPVSNATPSPTEKPREGATPRTKRECLASVVEELNLDVRDPFTLILANAFALDDLRRQLELELSQTRLERNSARNVLVRAIERERLANMRATEWEEAAEAARSAIGPRTACLLLAEKWMGYANDKSGRHPAAAETLQRCSVELQRVIATAYNCNKVE
jgi:hypothetical protein